MDFQLIGQDGNGPQNLANSKGCDPTFFGDLFGDPVRVWHRTRGGWSLMQMAETA